MSDELDVNLEALNKLNSFYLKRRMNLSKEEINFILGNKHLMMKFKSKVSPRLLKLKKMIKNGNVGVVYTFKIIMSSYFNEEVHPTYALFSLKKSNMINEEYYKRILSNILSLEESKEKKTYSEKRLLSILKEEDSDPRYYELPKSLTNNEIVYLERINVSNNVNPNFKLGMNYVIYNKVMSKDMLYYPDFLKGSNTKQAL
jgi:hypothetical protein